MKRELDALLHDAARGQPPSEADALAWLPEAPLAALRGVAEELALSGYGRAISY
jgi:hypothetical protein